MSTNAVITLALLVLLLLVVVIWETRDAKRTLDQNESIMRKIYPEDDDTPL